MIGGALARPVDAFPSIFPPGSIWDRFPYLLPNLFSAICVFCGVVIGILFLEETHAEKKLRRDHGVELGNRLISRLPWTSRKSLKGKAVEEQALLDPEEQLPVYRSTENSPLLSSTADGSDTVERLDLRDSKATRAADPNRKPVKPVTTIFTRGVVLNIVSYGILAL